MQKIAFIFPGQGSQYVGMGKDICAEYPVAKNVFDEADRVLGRSLTALCFIGPEEDLKDTRNAQLCILATSVALYRVFEEAGFKPDFMAGHSLGEYSALAAGGALPFDTVLRLVDKRARLMAEADPEKQGTMAAVLGLTREAVFEILKQASEGGRVEAANFNCPGQIVVSGAKNGIAKVQELVTAAGGKAIPLAVSGPFHSSLMRPAAEAIRDELAKAPWREPAVPLIANISALPAHRDELAENLYHQMYSSVLWEDSLNYLSEQGVTVFMEVGPGKVLSGLVKKTVKGVTILNCGDSDSVKKSLAILKEV